LIDILKCKDDPGEYNKLVKDIVELKKENKLIKERISNSNNILTKFKLPSINTQDRSGNIFSCFGKYQENLFTLNFSNINK
jgi:hypothetical protein